MKKILLTLMIGLIGLTTTASAKDILKCIDDYMVTESTEIVKIQNPVQLNKNIRILYNVCEVQKDIDKQIEMLDNKTPMDNDEKELKRYIMKKDVELIIGYFIGYRQGNLDFLEAYKQNK